MSRNRFSMRSYRVRAGMGLLIGISLLLPYGAVTSAATPPGHTVTAPSEGAVTREYEGTVPA
ncbi:MAG: hypothetical protein M3408_06100, partial [Actinomycetota bacterium]|nr:hypothetical protein [Actinomycetota bacterium]